MSRGQPSPYRPHRPLSFERKRKDREMTGNHDDLSVGVPAAYERARRRIFARVLLRLESITGWLRVLIR